MVLNLAHLHLILNHIPIIGIPFITILTIISLIKKDLYLGKLVHWLFIGITVLSVAVFLSGIGAQNVLHKAGISHEFIVPHHEASYWAMSFILGLGAWSTLALYANRKSSDFFSLKTSLIVTLLGAIATTVILALTANLGAKISHPEIRPEQWENNKHKK